MTLSGKSNLAKRLAREYQRRGVKVAVLDPLNDPDWCADFQTRDPQAFLQCVKRSRQLALFIDESGETIGRYNDEMFWLATRARHYGHKSHFISQRPTQLSRTVWTQCTELFLYNVSTYDAKLLADEFNKPGLREADSLAQYECFHAPRFGPLERLKVPKVGGVDKSGGVDNDSTSRDIDNRNGGRAGDSPEQSNIGGTDE